MTVDGYPHLSALIPAFERAFGRRPTLAVRAPGRVNLIGEHTDYNDGWVMPVALPYEVDIAAAPRADRRVRLVAPDVGKEGEFSLDDRDQPADLWPRYPQGVAVAMQEAGHALTGIDAVYAGDVPVGAGLSSSAAVEVAFVRAFAAVAGIELDGPTVARIAQRAETAFVGVPSGIMDQFISATGQAGHALLLDCRSLVYEQIPLNLPGVAIAIIDTGVRRELARSEYARRRADCEAAVAALRARLPGIRALRDVTPEQVEQHRDLITDVQFRRARHVTTENRRVLQAAEALRAGDAVRVGELMHASHVSLRDDYEVSSPELDAAVEIAWAVKGVVGARMTGAGFGGAAVALVQESAFAALESAIGTEFPGRTGRTATVRRCVASDGASAMAIG